MSASAWITDAGERLRRVDAGADRGAAERQLADARQARRSARSIAVLDLRGVAAELLAQRDGRRVHEVGAARLDHRLELVAACAAARARDASIAGMRSTTTASVAAMWIAEGNTSFDDCDALTWSFGCTGAPSRSVASVREHLVRVHVRRRARSRSGTRRSGTGRPTRPSATSSAARAMASPIALVDWTP